MPIITAVQTWPLRPRGASPRSNSVPRQANRARSLRAGHCHDTAIAIMREASFHETLRPCMRRRSPQCSPSMPPRASSHAPLSSPRRRQWDARAVPDASAAPGSPDGRVALHATHMLIASRCGRCTLLVLCCQLRPPARGAAAPPEAPPSTCAFAPPATPPRPPVAPTDVWCPCADGGGGRGVGVEADPVACAVSATARSSSPQGRRSRCRPPTCRRRPCRAAPRAAAAAPAAPPPPLPLPVPPLPPPFRW